MSQSRQPQEKILTLKMHADALSVLSNKPETILLLKEVNPAAYKKIPHIVDDAEKLHKFATITEEKIKQMPLTNGKREAAIFICFREKNTNLQIAYAKQLKEYIKQYNITITEMVIAGNLSHKVMEVLLDVNYAEGDNLTTSSPILPSLKKVVIEDTYSKAHNYTHLEVLIEQLNQFAPSAILFHPMKDSESKVKEMIKQSKFQSVEYSCRISEEAAKTKATKRKAIAEAKIEESAQKRQAITLNTVEAIPAREISQSPPPRIILLDSLAAQQKQIHEQCAQETQQQALQHQEQTGEVEVAYQKAFNDLVLARQKLEYVIDQKALLLEKHSMERKLLSSNHAIKTGFSGMQILQARDTLSRAPNMAAPTPEIHLNPQLYFNINLAVARAVNKVRSSQQNSLGQIPSQAPSPPTDATVATMRSLQSSPNLIYRTFQDSIRSLNAKSSPLVQVSIFRPTPIRPDVLSQNRVNEVSEVKENENSLPVAQK